MARRPTSTEEGTESRSGLVRFIAIIIVVGALIVVGAIYLGKSDNGQIDVAATIRQSNQAGGSGEGGENRQQIDVPSQTFQNMPNGGLVPSEGNAGNTETVETASSTGTSAEASTTATSTDAQASSTSVQGGDGTPTP